VRGELIVNIFREVIDQQVVDDKPDVFGVEALVDELYVLPLLNNADDAGIG